MNNSEIILIQPEGGNLKMCVRKINSFGFLRYKNRDLPSHFEEILTVKYYLKTATDRQKLVPPD